MDLLDSLSNKFVHILLYYEINSKYCHSAFPRKETTAPTVINPLAPSTSANGFKTGNIKNPTAHLPSERRK